MDCTTERIIQVSLSKITDSRRRRGGPTLRRNLLVSHILNNVLTQSDPAYATYRNTVDMDVDLDSAKTEAMTLDKPKVPRDDTGGSLAAGNGQEFSHSRTSAVERDTKAIVETVPSAADRASVESDRMAANGTDNTTGKAEGKNVCGTKRPRSEYVNEPCEKHAVTNKRCRPESASENTSDLEYQEPMDISGLISVFSGSFSGLSRSADNAGSRACFDTQPTYSFNVNSWPQTVEAF